MTGRACRVAVIEDDEDIRELVVQLLADLGFECVGYADGQEALEAMRRPGAVPGVIMLDLEMPRMNGWQFREEQLRDPLLAPVPVVITSATEPRGVQADAWLPKPFGTSDLCEVLARLSVQAAAAGHATAAA